MSSPTPTADVATPRLVARTAEVTSTTGLPRDLVDLLPPESPAAWLRRGEGIVAWGEAARFETEGPDRFTDAVDWWRSVSDKAVVRDEVAVPGTGLICVGSFGFADDPGDSVLIVPRVVVGTRGERSWVTVIGVDELSPIPELVSHAEVTSSPQRHLRRRCNERCRLGDGRSSRQ